MNTLPQSREIGHGHCGSVWTEGDGLATKREDGGPGRSIHKDADMPQRIEAALGDGAGVNCLNIPAFGGLVEASDTSYWAWRLPRFPNDATHKYEACNALVSERIQPFAQRERHNLIDRFCREDSRAAIKSSRSDEDCLIRAYLGRNTHNPRPPRFFTLRNRPLNLDQLQALQLPVEEYTRTMAEALAVIYWKAGIDANDVKFVLAPAGSHPASHTWPSEVLGEHVMWILDFDCCNAMTMDPAGIDQTAAAFYRNDPYYPRPGGEGEEITLCGSCSPRVFSNAALRFWVGRASYRR